MNALNQSPAWPPTSPAPRKIWWPAVPGAGTIGLLLGVFIGIGIGSVSTEPAAAASSPSRSAAAPPSQTLPPAPEDRFVADVLDTPGLTSTIGRSDLIQIGHTICGAIGTPGVSPGSLHTTIAESRNLGSDVASVLIRASRAHLCGGKAFAPGPPPPPPEPQPLDRIPPGVYEVGTGDGQVAPGRYRSEGPSGAGSCYYARLRNNDGSLNDIIDNGITEGQSLLTVQEGDGYLDVSGCTFEKID